MKVLTFNIWGLNRVSKYRQQRVAAIISALSSDLADIICLQELWLDSDYELIQQNLSHIYPHSVYFYSGLVGSGLAILSKHKIIESEFVRYELNGPPLEVIKGDWFSGKGFGRVSINSAELGLVDVYTTHFHAPYSESDEHARFAHRLSQAWQLSTHILNSYNASKSVILTGDINSEPFTLVFDLLTTHAHLVDCWAVDHPTHDKVPPHSPQDAVFRCGYTADVALNSFHQHRYPGYTPGDDSPRYGGGKRLDYVLLKSDSIEPTKSEICFNQLCPPDYAHSYSDHFGIITTFNNKDIPTSPTKSRHTDNDMCYMETIRKLRTLYKHSQKQSIKYIAFTALLIAFGVALIVASAFPPTAHYSPFFVFFAFLAGIAGATYLYVGYIYGQFERHSIKNLIGQIERYIDHSSN
ncbi:hypothetical protein E3P99_00758 [Wallemia hederae]|uniref:Endonuclease/exonuclease/phosphatase domain-containing protein n=1 Tax=Wallemia hederae TaxID=1540922 RepID=A0A4T0FTI1_9BASI|nr:hypothetical protein E3P99_00758 [Wallemia hederae]